MSRTLLQNCLLVLLLTSCAATGLSSPTPCPVQPVVTQTRIVDTGCDWNAPIYVSKTDILSDDTARAILQHNLTGAKRCGWKPRTPT